MALHGSENMSSIYDGASIPPPTSLQMTGPTASSTASLAATPVAVPTSFLSSMMGLPPLTASMTSGLAPTTLSASMASGSASTSLTVPTASGLAVVDEKVKKEGEERARQLNEFARQQLQVALREEGEDVEYDVDWELIRRGNRDSISTRRSIACNGLSDSGMDGSG